MEIHEIAFTGSWRSGQAVKCMAANSNMKACTLELGGKAPIILFEDGNVEKAARECAISVTFNSGQTRTSAARSVHVFPPLENKIMLNQDRLYAQESVLKPFLAVFRPTFEGFLTNHGDPLDPKVTHGPQADNTRVS